MVKENWKNLKFYLKILFSIFLIVAVFFHTDIGSVYIKLSGLPGYIFIIIFLVVCIQFFINVFIKNTMFSIFGFRERILVLYKKIFKGAFYSIFMPSMVGGDVYYTYHFGKKFNSYPKIFAGIFLIKLIGISVFFLFSILFVFYFKDILVANLAFEQVQVKKILIILFSIIFSLAILLLVFRNKFYIHYQSIREKINLIKNDILRKRQNLLVIVALSVLFYIVSIGGRVILGEVIGIDLPLLHLAGIIIMVNFLILIPVSVVGIGVREGSYVTLMGLFGIDVTTALTMSLVDFSITLIGVFVGGVFILTDNLKDNN
jgi:uncharacterized membrane protein YbhN (UPF0104 family)